MGRTIIPIERASRETIMALVRAGILVITEEGIKCAR